MWRLIHLNSNYSKKKFEAKIQMGSWQLRTLDA